MIDLNEEIDLIFRPNSDPSAIDREARLKAEKEVNETPEKLVRNIQRLKEMIKDDASLNARSDDIFLAAFLRARKHDVEKAFHCLKQYYEFKWKYPAYYSYCLPSENHLVYEQQAFASIAAEDVLGRRVCALIPARIDLDKTCMDETFKLGTTVFEVMLGDPYLQVVGTVIIIDLSELTLLQKARLATPSCAWHLSNVVQDKIPLRLKAVHVVNQPFYFNALYAVFRPFLKKKLRKRIFLHGKDMSSLHKHIPPSDLPCDWGGSRPPFNNMATMTIIKNNEHKLKEWRQYGYVGAHK